jgi:tripartite-type tricarboxylate transporter receptor subunit TctC
VTDLEARQASRDTLTSAIEASGQRFAVTETLLPIEDIQHAVIEFPVASEPPCRADRRRRAGRADIDAAPGARRSVAVTAGQVRRSVRGRRHHRHFGAGRRRQGLGGFRPAVHRREQGRRRRQHRGRSVAKADADGYTFIVGTPGIHAINQFVFKNMPYDQLRDIAPVIVIARVPNLCSVTNSLPVKSVAELIAYAKSKPGELLYGTPGLGSTAHVSCELFKSITGVDIIHVPYKGSAPALTDLIAGRVHLMIDNLPAAQPFAESGSIRPLAISTATRWPLLPDLPTIAEAGVPGYEAASWFTIGAPAKTHDEIINASVDKFLKSDDGIARLRKLGAEPAGGSPDEMQRYVLAEAGKWGKVAKFAGIKPE